MLALHLRRAERHIAAGAEAKDESSGSDLGDRGGRGRGYRGMAQVRVRYADTETEACRGAGGRGEHDERIASRALIADPQFVETDCFDLSGERCDFGGRTIGEQPDAYAYGHRLSGVRPAGRDRRESPCGARGRSRRGSRS